MTGALSLSVCDCDDISVGVVLWLGGADCRLVRGVVDHSSASWYIQLE